MGELRRAIAEYFSLGSRLGGPVFLGLLAEREADDQNIDEALRTIGEALAQASETGERWAEALVHRVRGDILLKRDPKNPEPSEGAYRTAVAIAKQQGARSYALSASLALAKLHQSANRAAEAHAVLAPAVEFFSPTPEMPEIAEAQALLSRLTNAA